MLTRASLVVLAVVASSACAAARAPNAPSTEGPLARSEIAVFDRAIAIDAMEAPTVTVDSQDGIRRTIVAVRVARFGLVACTVTRTRVEPGVVLSPLVTELATTAPKIDVTLAGDVPLLTVESAPGDAHPFVAAALSRAGGTVFCALDEPGHRARFDRVMGQLVAALAPAGDAPLFRDVRVVHTLGKTAGFQFREVAKNGDGRIASEQTTMLVAQDDRHWRIIDSARTTALDADGHVVRSAETLLTNGRLATEHTIVRTRPGEYAFEITGEFAKTGTFRSDRLSTELGMAPRIRALGASELRFDEWDSAAFDLRSVVVRRAGDRVIVARGDKRASTCEPDALGLCVDHGVDRLRAEGTP